MHEAFGVSIYGQSFYLELGLILRAVLCMGGRTRRFRSVFERHDGLRRSRRSGSPQQLDLVPSSTASPSSYAAGPLTPLVT